MRLKGEHLVTLMQLPPLIKQAEEKLEGEPDQFLTIALITVCIFGIAVALKGPRVLKVAVLAWFLMP